MRSRYDQLRRKLAQISDLGRARALLAWDERTKMPAAGGAARAEQLATLARVRHERATDPALGELLYELERSTADSDPDSDESAMVRMARRDFEKATRINPGLRAEMTRAASLGEQAWEQARANDDFAAYLPFLQRNIELVREFASLFIGWEGIARPYDALLDEFEPGIRTDEVSELLGRLRSGLTPLVERARARVPRSGAGAERAPLRGGIAIADQQRVCRELVAALPLRADSWRLDSTVHPFAVAIGEGDIRVTTRYDEADLATAVWSVLHECGHALYDSGVPRRLRRSPLGRPSSLGIHESQSRLWENQVGRSEPFCRWLAPRLAGSLPGLRDLTPKGLHAAVNVIEPTLIRVEADEVTYNLHIALRFEVELELFEGGLDAADLPEAWREQTRNLLGLEVPSDSLGVMQDVHWSSGAFGYFPTYSLGNILAAQLWERAAAELGSAETLDEHLAAGDFAPLHGWLAKTIFRHGGKLLPGEMIERSVGGLDPTALLRHLDVKVDTWLSGA